MPPTQRDRVRSRSRMLTVDDAHAVRPTRARSMDLCQTRGAETCRSSSTCRPSGSSSCTASRWPRSSLDFFDQLKSRTQGYAQPRLRARRLPAVEPREGRRAAERRAGRRVQHDRPPRQGLRVRPTHVREAARAHPAADVRRAHPGRDRRPHHRPRDGQGEAQGRARQVLRRRHHPQAQAAREAEGRQEADEEHRARRGAPGSASSPPCDSRSSSDRSQACGLVHDDLEHQRPIGCRASHLAHELADREGAATRVD